jgi:hypothetical protein
MAEIFPLPCVSFVAMVQSTSDLLGTATSAALRETGKLVGDCDASLEEIQGPSEEIKPGVFVQKRCPFADAVALYAEQGRKLPPSVKELAEFANQHGGAWVSAFCGVHQNLRLTKNPGIVQIACKAGDGNVNFADNEFMTEEEAREILRNAVCIYAG